ncbi:MAG: hypothetical protein H7A19_00730 [Rhodanobacteraceae bacterium]|nr:hypothetical protein [Rhodanobacteraceae bacterium]
MALPSFLSLSGHATAQTVSLDNVTPISLSSSSTVSAVSINASTGNVIVRSSVGDYISCNRQPVPTINSFAPSVSAVQTGANITLNWSSSNTTSCSPSQGAGTTWSSFGTLPTSGSQTFAAPGTAQTITFQLTCTNGTTNASQTTQVVVQSGGGGGNCIAAYPTAQTANYASVFSNAQNAWPAFGVRKRILVPFNGYVAYSFTATSTPGQFGTFATSDYPGDGDGVGLMSISAQNQQGCFDPSKLGPNCLSPVSRFVSIGWANGSTQFSCSLTPGTTYWLNWTYGGTTVPGSGPYCPIGPSSCGADAQNQVQD